MDSMAAGVELWVTGDEAFRDAAALWLDEGTSLVDAELRADVEARRAGGPYGFSPDDVAGAPGEAFGVYGVGRGRGRGGGGRAGAGTIASLPGKVKAEVDAVSATLQRLDAEGRLPAPSDSGAWVWNVNRIWGDGELVRLHVQSTGPSLLLLEDGKRGDAARAGLAELTRRAAVSAPMLFGFAGPCGSDGGTPWEEKYHVPSHAALSASPYGYRGLGWVTALPDRAVAAVGGLEGLRRLPLHAVEPLPGGGAWLVATPDLRQATPELLVALSEELDVLAKGAGWISGWPAWS